ncbi:50S ribosomal protein L10 [Candidatus Hydrogenosomobacter endosymbioticus]|uniref:Large ribosomal subunit protein uL10 n=1 Tax=Candidatus Hydrogenosomobacter endosymbioticus TaxID=2558174 RepID=A0ABM7V9T1_9PROT|nr:50S ribosomal protein L10 [Candidatus Hydrogenosomobacter endosymbioticus]BDB96548.1 50S ribosomal protein L10 [Candidatus Hydrogenosomobacter endosymbioticus]
MNRQEKAQFISDLKGLSGKYPIAVLTRQSGLTVSSISEFRRKVRGVGAQFIVVNNRLAKISFDGMASNGFIDEFRGPCALLFGDDPVGSAKVAVDFADENDGFKVVCAYFDGDVLDVVAVKNLASLPSLDVLRSQLLSLLLASATEFVSVLQAPSRKLVCVLDAYRKKLAKEN